MKFNLNALTNQDLNGFAWMSDSVMALPEYSLETINRWIKEGSLLWSNDALMVLETYRFIIFSIKNRNRKNLYNASLKLEKSENMKEKVVGRLLKAAYKASEGILLKKGDFNGKEKKEKDSK